MKECVVEHIKGAGTPHSMAKGRLPPAPPGSSGSSLEKNYGKNLRNQD